MVCLQMHKVMLVAFTDSADAAAVERGRHRKQENLLKLYELLTELKKHVSVPTSICIHSSCTSVNPVNTQATKLPDQSVSFTVACSDGLYCKYSYIWGFFVSLTSKSSSWYLLITRVIKFH